MVEGARLEIVWAGNSLGGSNPLASAIFVGTKTQKVRFGSRASRSMRILSLPPFLFVKKAPTSGRYTSSRLLAKRLFVVVNFSVAIDHHRPWHYHRLRYHHRPWHYHRLRYHHGPWHYHRLQQYHRLWRYRRLWHNHRH